MTCPGNSGEAGKQHQQINVWENSSCLLPSVCCSSVCCLSAGINNSTGNAQGSHSTFKIRVFNAALCKIKALFAPSFRMISFYVSRLLHSLWWLKALEEHNKNTYKMHSWVVNKSFSILSCCWSHRYLYQALWTGSEFTQRTMRDSLRLHLNEA